MPVGNEEYNAQYVEQVAALEAKAKALGVGSNQLYYLFPQNRGVNNSDGPKAKALGLNVHAQERFFHEEAERWAIDPWSGMGRESPQLDGLPPLARLQCPCRDSKMCCERGGAEAVMEGRPLERAH